MTKKIKEEQERTAPLFSGNTSSPDRVRKSLNKHSDKGDDRFDKQVLPEKVFQSGITDNSNQSIVPRKVVIATQYNRVHLQRPYKFINHGKSITVPDQSLTIRELIQRSQRGYPLDASYTPFYNGEDDDMPDIRKLDLTELQELRDETNKTIKEREKAIRDAYRADQEKKTEEYYKQKFSSEQKQQQPKAEGKEAKQEDKK